MSKRNIADASWTNTEVYTLHQDVARRKNTNSLEIDR